MQRSTSAFPAARWAIQSRLLLVATMAVTWSYACQFTSAQQEFEGWNLEPGVGQAHLVMVARVASISQLTVVEGAKTDVSLREYRFQPVRVLKGIFPRDQLSMTAADLGCRENDPASTPNLREGEYRLLILVQPRGVRSMGCVSASQGATTFAERVPLLSGPDDPLVSVAETLIRVADSRSRKERAALLVKRLNEIDGLAAVPLLSSLRLRADWAATEPTAYAALALRAQSPQPQVRAAVYELLRDMLAHHVVPGDPKQLAAVAQALRALLESDEPITRMRVHGIEALGHLLALTGELDWPRELLIAQLDTAATYAERTAAVASLAQIAQPQATTAVLEALAALPLDEGLAREQVFAKGAIRLDPSGAARALQTRLERSIAARQLLEGEIASLGQLGSIESVPLLLSAAKLNLPNSDRYQLARALGMLGDDRAVPVLIDWMRGVDYGLREVALGALETIDSPLAAREARPLLKTEANLQFKLRLARLLARHKIDDGYALAIEHLADAEHTATATLVLVALGDPRTSTDLSRLLAERPDRSWYAAVLSGLAAIGDPAARDPLLDILNDDRNPMAADAAQTAGLAGDVGLLLPLGNLARSRNRQIALASLTALRRHLSDVRTSPLGLAVAEIRTPDFSSWANLPSIGIGDGEAAVAGPIDRGARAREEARRARVAELPPETRAAIFDAVAALARDTYVEPELRVAALSVARLLRGDSYAQLLSDLADQAELEGSPLLTEVQRERKE